MPDEKLPRDLNLNDVVVRLNSEHLALKALVFAVMLSLAETDLAPSASASSCFCGAPLRESLSARLMESRFMPLKSSKRFLTASWPRSNIAWAA